mmetsp:Transcript_24199/g.49584  ORF Transcript_24199/g.49584 Transcript_24199/m.49584 type:complete len:96 (-) Transcript_24199:35-322(-)
MTMLLLPVLVDSEEETLQMVSMKALALETTATSVGTGTGLMQVVKVRVGYYVAQGIASKKRATMVAMEAAIQMMSSMSSLRKEKRRRISSRCCYY